MALLISQGITRIADVDLTHPAISGLTAEDLAYCLQASCIAQSARCEPAVRRMMRGQRHWSPSEDRAWRPLKEIGELPPIVSHTYNFAIISQWENLVWQTLYAKNTISNRIHITLLTHCLSDKSDPMLSHVVRRGSVSEMFDESPEKHGLMVRKAHTSMIPSRVHEDLVKIFIKPTGVKLRPIDPITSALISKIP